MSYSRRTPSEVKNKVRELLKQKYQKKEISKLCGVSLRTVFRIANAIEPVEKNLSKFLIKIHPLGKAIAFNDTHIPYCDFESLDLVYRFIESEKPQEIIIVGDWIDFYAVSRFSKDPSRALSLQDELDVSTQWLARLRKENAAAKIVFILGNHEYRLRKYLWSTASPLSCLRCLQFEELLGLKVLNVVPVDEHYTYRGLLMTHGELVRKSSGSTAKGMMEKYGVNLLHGHCHRTNNFSHRYYDHRLTVWENGCLCKLKADYDTCVDWQQGFSCLYDYGDGRDLRVEQVSIENGRFVHGDALFYANSGVSV